MEPLGPLSLLNKELLPVIRDTGSKRTIVVRTSDKQWFDKGVWLVL